MNRHFTEKETQLAGKLMKRFSTSSQIREIQIKTMPMRYNSQLAYWEKEKNETIANVKEAMKHWKLSYTVNGSVNTIILENKFGIIFAKLNV